MNQLRTNSATQSTETSQPLTRRPLPRRTIAASVAWSVPVVAASSAVPAFASSQCVMTNGRMTLSGATGTGTVGGVTMRATSRAVGVTVDSEWNLKTTDQDGPGEGSTEITQWPVRDSTTNPQWYHQDVTFTFSQPVENLSFQIADLDKIYDWNPDGYDDKVAVTAVNGAAPSGRVTGTNKGSLVAGAGTLADPWRNTATRSGTSGLAPTDQRGYVTVNVAGETTSITLRYWSTATSNYNTQAIWVGNMTYSVCV